jgi:hypothetical protein
MIGTTLKALVPESNHFMKQACFGDEASHVQPTANTVLSEYTFQIPRLQQQECNGMSRSPPYHSDKPDVLSKLDQKQISKLQTPDHRKASYLKLESDNYNHAMNNDLGQDTHHQEKISKQKHGPILKDATILLKDQKLQIKALTHVRNILINQLRAARHDLKQSVLANANTQQRFKSKRPLLFIRNALSEMSVELDLITMNNEDFIDPFEEQVLDPFEEQEVVDHDHLDVCQLLSATIPISAG